MSIGTVPIPPFEVRPPYFQLGKGESSVIEILFVPNAKETYQESIVMVCDNCHVKYFNITGKCSYHFTRKFYSQNLYTAS